MTNQEIARRFNRMASLMEVRGEDSFRIRSYRMAAEAIETWPTEMQHDRERRRCSRAYWKSRRGKAIAGKIIELWKRAHSTRGIV
jgi:DNA polymerase/3'-5' exonuclease PolX